MKPVDLALTYTPFPATVCGYLCPNLCMHGCTRGIRAMPALDVALWAGHRWGQTAGARPGHGKTIAVVGGGPAGMSVAWQLCQMGHQASSTTSAKQLGGKITAPIPKARIPDEVVGTNSAASQKASPTSISRSYDEKGFSETPRADTTLSSLPRGRKNPG